MIPFRKAAKAFPADRGGNFAVLTAAAAAAILLAAGFALNIGQIVMTRSNLLNALDSAVTSTARDITTGRLKSGEARETIEAFLHANGDAGFMSADRIVLDSLEIDREASTLRVKASVDVDMIFPLFGASPVRTVSAESAAIYSDRKIEVAMMLDITGSMSGRKLDDLKTAAKNAAKTLLSSNGRANPRVRVAIVPYANSVNTGILDHTVFIEDKYTESDPPRLDNPRLAGLRRDDKCATERKGSLQFTDASPYGGMVNRDFRLGFCPSVPLRPLTTSLADLEDTIGRFKAHGHTAGHIGIQWSWYLLSPKWASMLPSAARPEEYGKGKVAKYAILMTDGEFNTAYAGVPEHERTEGGQPVRSRDYAKRLCDRMKEAGIEIFTVGFMLTEPGAKDVMRDCASPDNSIVRHNFQTGNGAELDAAFQEIAQNIERLALTK
jgi:Flp pilus assembly protein TadG